MSPQPNAVVSAPPDDTATRARRVLILEQDQELAHLLELALARGGTEASIWPATEAGWIGQIQEEHGILVAGITSEAEGHRVLSQVRDAERGRQPVSVVLLTAGAAEIPDWSPLRRDPDCRLLSKLSMSLSELLEVIEAL